MIQTADEANALLERCNYRHPWASKVTWRLERHGDKNLYMMSITYHEHPDTTIKKHYDSFTAGSHMLGPVHEFMFLPATEEEIVQMAYRLLLAVEEHEVGERFTIDEAPVFHPHAFPNGTWCGVLDGDTWINEIHALEPRRKPTRFNLAERLRIWKEGFK